MWIYEIYVLHCAHSGQLGVKGQQLWACSAETFHRKMLLCLTLA